MESPMDQTKTLRVGSRAPAFSLPTTQGTPATLEAHQGHRLVLVFYPLAWTPV